MVRLSSSAEVIKRLTNASGEVGQCRPWEQVPTGDLSIRLAAGAEPIRLTLRRPDETGVSPTSPESEAAVAWERGWWREMGVILRSQIAGIKLTYRLQKIEVSPEVSTDGRVDLDVPQITCDDNGKYHRSRGPTATLRYSTSWGKYTYF